MVKRCWSEINLDLIEHNVREIEKLMGKTRIMGILKADAYGHGAIECARKLIECGVDFLAVAGLSEAIELRKAGIDTDILILGYTPEEGFEDLRKYNLVQSVVSLPYARQLNDFGNIRVHVKLDTGMRRSGLVWQDDEKSRRELAELYSLENLAFEGIYSHFASSDELDQDGLEFTAGQKDLFDRALAFLKEEGIEYGLTHLQNSYGILNYGDMGYDYCRPGLLYMGVSSDKRLETRFHPDLAPILSLKARVGLIKEIQPGDSVSYGRHFTAEKPMKIAGITIGYADGLTRLCSNRGLEVLINGKRCPVLGNICMDQTMVDVTGVDVKPGDEAVIIGQSGDELVDVDTISALSETINNETLCRLGQRVDRFYIQNT